MTFLERLIMSTRINLVKNALKAIDAELSVVIAVATLQDANDVFNRLLDITHNGADKDKYRYQPLEVEHKRLRSFIRIKTVSDPSFSIEESWYRGYSNTVVVMVDKHSFEKVYIEQIKKINEKYMALYMCTQPWNSEGAKVEEAIARDVRFQDRKYAASEEAMLLILMESNILKAWHRDEYKADFS